MSDSPGMALVEAERRAAAAAYGAGDLDAMFEALERAHAESVRSGDRIAAADAAVQIAMHLLMDTGLMAPVRGWASRAERLLDGLDQTPVHAWLAVARMYERMLAGDFPASRNWARRAIDVGTAHRQPGAVALGRVATARALIFEGAVQEGLALLDEAAVAAMSGELDPISAGMVYCELLCACQGLAQYERAEEWTHAMERWRQRENVGSLGGRCRVHRAELLRLRGSCAEAEGEAQRACDELKPYLRIEYGWPLTELGRIRLRMGDLDGAEEAFVAAHETGWDPEPGLALLRLARGEIAAASASIRDALERPRNVPSKELPPNTDLRRAPLLEAQVEIAIAVGDLACARTAADELTAIAASFPSKAIAAGASLARGRVLLAMEDAPSARNELEKAVRSWIEVGAPYEAAVARVNLAEALRAQGNEAQATMETRAALVAFERVGATLEGDRLARRTPAPDPSPSDRSPLPHPVANGLRHEGDYWSIEYEGRTIRVKDLRGLRYLSRLLTEPGRELHVLDLAGAASAEAAGDAGELLDTRAKETYTRRLAEIDEDLAEASAFGDLGRLSRARDEREFLVRELSRAVGLGGRDRRACSASERARASVTQAVRHAMARIKEMNAELGAHLDRTVRTGTYCAYLPDPRAPTSWKI